MRSRFSQVALVLILGFVAVMAFAYFNPMGDVQAKWTYGRVYAIGDTFVQNDSLTWAFPQAISDYCLNVSCSGTGTVPYHLIFHYTGGDSTRCVLTTTLYTAAPYPFPNGPSLDSLTVVNPSAQTIQVNFVGRY